MRSFPDFVYTYNLDNAGVEVNIPEGKTQVTVTTSATIRCADGGGQAAGALTAAIEDGTGSFHIHPDESLDDRTFSTVGVVSFTFFGTAEVALIWE